MFEEGLIIGLVMAFMELLKRFVPSFPKEAYFLPIMIMAAGFSALSAYLFGEMAVAEAVVEGIKLGAMAAGIFGLGKAVLGLS